MGGLMIDLRSAAECCLEESRAIRAAFPDTNSMQAVPVAGAPDVSEGRCALRLALGHLRAEITLLRAGKSDTLAVLDDESSHVLRLLSVAPPPSA
jgi:hypothetical protein